MTMVATTIQQALHPLLVTSSFMGLGVYTQKRSRLCLSILYSLIIWTSYAFFFCYVMIFTKLVILTRAYTFITNTCISSLTTVTTIVMFIQHDKEFKIFLKRLAAVNDTLEELGSPKEYDKLHAWMKRATVVWIIYICLAKVNDTIWCLYELKDYWSLLYCFVITHHYHVNEFVDLLFVILVWYIGTRFDRVNECVRCLLVKQEHELRCTWTKAVPISRRYIMRTDDHKRLLWTSMQLHLELCKLTRELNGIYGIQITLEIVTHLIFMTGLCHYFYINITTMSNYVVSIRSWFDFDFWACVCTIRLFYLNHICEVVSAKANEIKNTVSQVTDSSSVRYADVRDEIYQFILQLMHRPLKFSGMGFFYFGYACLRKIYIRILTFIIIIVQMRAPIYLK